MFGEGLQTERRPELVEGPAGDGGQETLRAEPQDEAWPNEGDLAQRGVKRGGQVSHIAY
ncbi:MAG: hypothetical protein ACE5F6_08710 [Anaerolineae bacterium]